MTSAAGGEPPVFTRMYDITRWLLERAAGFPRVLRTALAERLTENALLVLEDLTRAQFSKRRLPLLIACNDRLNVLRVLLRLAKDTQALSFRQYEFVSAELQEVGRMLGGWIAYERQT